MLDRCGCGDNTCPYCYPGTWWANLEYDRLLKRGLVCEACREEKETKLAYGTRLCKECLLETLNTIR